MRTNRNLCHLKHKLIGFYNPDEKCLQRGTDWGFKYSCLRLVCKGLIIAGLEETSGHNDRKMNGYREGVGVKLK